MSSLSADVFCQKIESVCDALSYVKKARVENKLYLGSLVSIRDL